VGGLPTAGNPSYVRPWSLISGVWQFHDYAYTATAPAPTLAQMLTPAPAPTSTLMASTVIFRWTGGTGVSQYLLYVGTTAGGADLLNQDRGTSLSATVPGLPTGRSPLYLRLWSFISGAWQFHDSRYTATTTAPTRAEMLTPAPGSTMTASTVTFQWTGGTGVSQYWVYVGTTAGGTDLLNQDRGTNLSATVAGLPTGGSPLYVRLWSLLGGAWQFHDYTYAAATTAATQTQTMTPAPGSTLTPPTTGEP
jgi:serine protease